MYGLKTFFLFVSIILIPRYNLPLSLLPDFFTFTEADEADALQDIVHVHTFKVTR